MRKAIQFSWQITGVLLAVLWLFQASAVAGIYKWRDDQGKLHFTDSKSKIPLKYRDQVEKFKGVAEPTPKSQPSPPSSGSQGSGNGETEAKLEQTENEPEGTSKKPPAKSKYTKEQLALLKSVKTYMVRQWAGHLKLLKNIKPTRINGKYYISSATKSASSKKAIMKRIGSSPIPSLVAVKKYLRKSSANDVIRKMGEPEFMEHVMLIKKTFEAEVPQLKALIEKLEADIGPEEEDPPPAE